MSIWTRVGVIAGIISAAIPTIAYVDDVWESRKDAIELEGYQRGLASAQTNLDQKIKSSNLTFKNELNALIESKNTALQAAKLELNNVNNSNTILTSKLKIAEENLQLSEEKLDLFDDKVQNLERQIDRLAAKLRNRDSKFDDLSKQLNDTQDELLLAKNTIENQNKKLESLRLREQKSSDIIVKQPPSDCVSSGQIVELPLDDFFQECKSKQIVSLRYVNSRMGIKNVKIFVEDKETRLKTGEAAKLPNGCKVRFLSFTRSGTKNSPAKFRLECR